MTFALPARTVVAMRAGAVTLSADQLTLERVEFTNLVDSEGPWELPSWCEQPTHG